MATKKLAYRRLVRNQPDNQLHVEFVDAQTGEVITNLSGYTLVDQGNDTPKTTTTAAELPVDPRKGRTGPARKDEGNTDWGDTHKQDYSRGSNAGVTDLGQGINNTLKVAKQGIDAIGDTKEKIQYDLATWITQVTGGAVVPDNIKKTDVNENGTKVGTAYSVPPASNMVRPTGDSAALDKVMGADSDTPSNAIVPATLSDGQVAKNVYMSNSDAIRNQAVRSTVLTDLAAVVNATDPSVIVKVNSGGQEPIDSKDAITYDPKNPDPNANRLPKTVNHDVDVNETAFASDQQYFKNGKQITPASDPAFFKELAKNATIAGFTQIGMGKDIVHLGKDPKDTYVRTWPYGNFDVSIIDEAVAEGTRLRQANPELYTKMVQAVAANDPNAPRPLSRASDALAGNESVPHPAVVAANEVRKDLGLTPILDATQEALAGVSNSITRYDINIPEMPPLNKGDLDKMRMLGLDNPFGGIVRGAADGMLKDAFGGMVGAAKQIIPAVASNMAGGVVDSLNSGITSAREALSGFMQPKEQATTINPTPNSLQTMTGLPHIDVAKAQAEEAKQTLQQAKVEEQINKKLALADAGFMGKAATGKPISEPISDAYSLKNAERRDLLIRTVLGEAEGEGAVGQLAVINTIKNRSLANGADPLDIIRKPEQFDGIKRASQFDPNSPLYKKAGALLDLAFKGELPDNTGGATHFHAGWDAPGWGAKLVESGAKPLTIGGHTFYSEGKNPMGMEGTSTGFLGPQDRRPAGQIDTLNNGQAFVGSSQNKPTTQSTGFMQKPRTTLSEMTGLNTKTPAKIPAGVNTSSGGSVTKPQADAIRSTGGGKTSDGPYTPSWQSTPASSGSSGVGSISGGVAKNPSSTPVPRPVVNQPSRSVSIGSTATGASTTKTVVKNSTGSKANSLDGN